MPLLANLTPEDIKINDPFVGEVYANVLDFYDNPSYNLRLYMVRQQAVKDLQEKLNNGTFSNDTLIAPNDMVILAQTAVTGVQIDNLEIEALTGYEGAQATKASFVITEPGGASFLDQIQYSKGYLKSNPETFDTTMFLDIRFQGYTSDVNNNEQGGEITIISGPITYEMKITSIDLRMDENGSEYSFEALILNTYSFSDSAFTMPLNFDSKGTTITEHVKSIEEELNRWAKEDTSSDFPDEYEIQMDQVIGAGQPDAITSIQDETVIQNLELKEGSARPPTASVTEPQDSGDAETDNSTAEIKSNPNQAEQKPEILLISHLQGETLERMIERIFSNNKEYLAKSTRKKDPESSESEAKTDQATVAFVKVVTKTYTTQYDKKRNKFARKYVIIPIMYKTANVNVEDPSTQAKNEEEKVTRLKQLKAGNHLIKSYNYLFTGLNDQIIDLDISYNTGVVTLLAPKGGAIGDPAITNRQLAPTTPEGTDTSLGGFIKDVANAAKDLSDFAKGLDIFEKLGSLSDSLQDQFVTAAEGVLGAGSSDAIRAALGDRDAAQGLLEGLVGQEIASIASAQFLEGTSEITTEEPKTNLPNGGIYTPELSQFKYSDDFLNADEVRSTIKTAEDLTKLGYINVDEVEFVEPKPSAEAKRDIASPFDTNAIEVGTVSNKLYGFMSAQKGADVFLSQIDMTVRGDPWYLCTSDPLADSNGEQANFKKGPNCFWLRIGAPRRYDLDWRDEDLNTGYWNTYGHSRMFSGVYQMTSVVNKFTGGEFTTTVSAFRVFGLDSPASENLKEALEDSVKKSQELQRQLEQDAADAAAAKGDDAPTGGNPE